MNGHSVRIPREIEEWPSFKVMADQIDPGRQDLDARLEGLLFDIARVPELFPSNNGLSIARYIGRPRMRIWFTYGPRKVILLGIEEV